nr:MAG TPA: hypothetical protein [Bacteriophage sp.]
MLSVTSLTVKLSSISGISDILPSISTNSPYSSFMFYSNLAYVLAF